MKPSSTDPRGRVAARSRPLARSGAPAFDRPLRPARSAPAGPTRRSSSRSPRPSGRAASEAAQPRATRPAGRRAGGPRPSARRRGGPSRPRPQAQRARRSPRRPGRRPCCAALARRPARAEQAAVPAWDELADACRRGRRRDRPRPPSAASSAASTPRRSRPADRGALPRPTRPRSPSSPHPDDVAVLDAVAPTDAGRPRLASCADPSRRPGAVRGPDRCSGCVAT